MADTQRAVHAAGVFSSTEKPALSMDRVDSVMTDDTATIGTRNAVNGPSTTTTTPPTLPTQGADGVRVLGLHEWKEAGLSLAEAFREDEVSKYFLDTPDRAHWSPQQKWDLHLKIMEYITYAHLLKGLVVCAGPDYDCVALWMPPGNNMDDYLTIFRSGMWRLHFALSGEGKARFFTEFLPLLHDTKAQILADRDDASWYLVYLGTRPSGRGKGYARRVVDYVTGLADAEGRACYLESSNPVNRKIYAKMGFGLMKNIYLQREREHVELDIMVREPAGKRAREGEGRVLGKA